MAHCCFSFVASLLTWFAAILYMAAFGTDWWFLTWENRANLFSYTLSTRASVSSRVSYTWSFMCSNPDCENCRTAVALRPDCDSRPAGVSCPSSTAPGAPSAPSLSAPNWCQAMNAPACTNMFLEACVLSARKFYDDDFRDDSDDYYDSDDLFDGIDKRQVVESCAQVTQVSGACVHAQNCAVMIGVAMGFGILTSVLSIVVLALSLRQTRSKHARRWAIAITFLLFLELCFGVTGFSLGHIWSSELPESSIRPGLWCASFAFVVNFVALILYLCVSALNDPKPAENAEEEDNVADPQN